MKRFALATRILQPVADKESGCNPREVNPEPEGRWH